MDATGLVFSAVAVREGAELAELIAAADYLNRTVLTPDEFESAVRKLLGGRLVEEAEPLQFRLTDAGRALWARTGDGGGIDRFVRASRLIPSGPEVEWSLDRRAFESAEASYGERMKTLMHRGR